MRKTYTYTLMPTPAQERSLETVVWRCRDRYNAGLQARKDAWETCDVRRATCDVRRATCGVSVPVAMQSAQLPGINAVRPDYRASNAQVVQDVLHRLDNTFQAFFRRLRAGETPGSPRFQSRNRDTSFADPHVGEHGGAVLDGRALSLSKIGRIPIRVHRPREGTPQDRHHQQPAADGWQACRSWAAVPAEPLPVTGEETGIAVGLKVVLVTADGEIVEHPRRYQKAERPLANAQRRVSRRKKGGKRRTKALKLLARAQQQVPRQRSDCHQKTALALVREDDTLYLEDLQARTLSRRPQAMPDGNGGDRHTGAAHKAGLNNAIHDAGGYAFRRIRPCQAAWAGKRVEAVPPASTTQDCSGCGERVYKRLSVRTHVCTNCGLMLDRDETAARTIRRAGQARQALPWPVAASVA